jgi:hypothetical protein
MSSAAEAELGALFINAKEAVYIRNMLEEMGHMQPRTPIQTDNSTAEGFINNKIAQKCLKSMDMRFNWLKCREAQEQFRFYWRPGGQNLADYWTKHHPASHHQNMRAEFLMKLDDLKELRAEAKERAHHVDIVDENMHTTSEKLAKSTSVLDTWVEKSGPREASCKGVLDDVRTYR